MKRREETRSVPETPDVQLVAQVIVLAQELTGNLSDAIQTRRLENLRASATHDAPDGAYGVLRCVVAWGGRTEGGYR